MWSAGVNLVRAGAVTVESQSDEEVVLRVRAPGRAVPAQVVLYPGEDEWDCDCPGRLRPCEHLAAAAIALGQDRQARRSPGRAAAEAKAPVLTSAAVWARVAYRFAQADGGLTLRRFIVRADGSETPLDGTLSALLSRPAEARSLQVEQCDLQADRLLETAARGVLPPSKLDALIQVSGGLPDGLPRRPAGGHVRGRGAAHAVVTDRDDGVAVTIRRDPRITAVPSAGVVLMARRARPPRRARAVRRLPAEPAHRPHATPRPSLARWRRASCPSCAAAWPSRCAPAACRASPAASPRAWCSIFSQVGSSLAVLPTLVYGNPPCARIDDGPAGPPARSGAGARRAGRAAPGRKAARGSGSPVAAGAPPSRAADTARFVEKLKRWRGELAGDGAKLVGVTRAPRAQAARGKLATARTRACRACASISTSPCVAEGKARIAGHGRRRGGAARLARGARPGAARRRRLRAVARGVAGQARQELAALLAARADDGRVATHALPTLGRFCDDLDQPPPPGLDRLAPLAESFDRLPEATLPADLTRHAAPLPADRRELAGLPAQRGPGRHPGRRHGPRQDPAGACACSTGKTLVVCPTSVLPNWQRRAGALSPLAAGQRVPRPGRTLDDSADVTLTSYAILRLDGEDLTRRRCDAVILDEAQAIKNPDSQVARAAYALNADFRLALTGTPVENRLEELWSLMHFANRGLLGGRREFDAEVARPIADGVPGAAAALRQRIRPFVLRRLKADVAPELPPRTEAVLTVALDERERAVYDAVRAATQSDLVAALRGRRRQARRDEGARGAAAPAPGGLPPGARARAEGRHVVEGRGPARGAGDRRRGRTQGAGLLAVDLAARSHRAGAARRSASRSSASTARRAIAATWSTRFQAEIGPPVMLISLKAGGTGLNLTAADHVFLCDPWWNPAVEDQAADRAHRIGQERPVMVYRLVAADTVEERILALQERKRAIGEAAWAMRQRAASLTREDLLALLA